jgi:hypothetical protein
MTSPNISEIDLSHGLSLSGRLTHDDVRRSEALRQCTTEAAQFWPKIFLYVTATIVGVIVAYFWFTPPDDVQAVVPRVDPPHVDHTSWFVFGAILCVLSIMWMVRRIQRSQINSPRPEPWRLPCQLLIQEDAMYYVSESILDRMPWGNWKRYVAPDVVMLEQNPDQRIVLPRRFCRNDADWNEFLALTERHTTTVPPPRGLKVDKPDVTPAEEFSFVDRWSVLHDPGRIVAQSTGSVTPAEVTSVYSLWRGIIATMAPLWVPGLLGLVGYLALSSAAFRAFCGGVAVSHLGFTVFFLWHAVVGRKQLTQKIRAGVSDSITIYDQLIEHRGQTVDTCYLWSELQRGRSTPEILTLVIGPTNRVLFLSQRMFRRDEWDRLQARAANLPEDTSGITTLRS